MKPELAVSTPISEIMILLLSLRDVLFVSVRGSSSVISVKPVDLREDLSYVEEAIRTLV